LGGGGIAGEGEREGEGKGGTREGGTVPVGLLARNTNQTEAPRQGNSTRRKKRLALAVYELIENVFRSRLAVSRKKAYNPLFVIIMICSTSFLLLAVFLSLASGFAPVSRPRYAV